MEIVLIRLGSNTEEIAYPSHVTKIENLGIGYITSYLRTNGRTVKIIDSDIDELDHNNIIQEVKLQSPRIAGISVMSHSQISSAIHISREMKQIMPGLIIIAGGPAATYAAQTLLTPNYIDCVVMYEGECVFLNLCNNILENKDWKTTPGIAYIHSNKYKNNSIKNKPNICKLPWPARDYLKRLLAKPRHSTSIISSRGCQKKCIFCTNQEFFGGWRGRYPHDVVEEIEHLKITYGITSFDFQDANFIGPIEYGTQRAYEIANKLISRQIRVKFRFSCTSDSVNFDLFRLLKEAGLYGVNIGIESGCQNALDYFRKGITVAQNVEALKILHDLDLMNHSTIGFIMFWPNAKIEDIKTNIVFLKKYVKLINPKCLTNELESPFFNEGKKILLKPCDNKILVAKSCLSIISSYSLESYLAILDHDNTSRHDLLNLWCNKTLKLADNTIQDIITKDSFSDEKQLKDFFEGLVNKCEKEYIQGRVLVV